MNYSVSILYCLHLNYNILRLHYNMEDTTIAYENDGFEVKVYQNRFLFKSKVLNLKENILLI